MDTNSNSNHSHLAGTGFPVRLLPWLALVLCVACIIVGIALALCDVSHGFLDWVVAGFGG